MPGAPDQKNTMVITLSATRTSARAAYAVMLGGATYPFIPTSVGQGIGLLVAAIGFIAVSVSLVRMSDEEFDLPPRAVDARPDHREAH